MEYLRRCLDGAPPSMGFNEVGAPPVWEGAPRSDDSFMAELRQLHLTLPQQHHGDFKKADHDNLASRGILESSYVNFTLGKPKLARKFLSVLNTKQERGSTKAQSLSQNICKMTVLVVYGDTFRSQLPNVIQPVPGGKLLVVLRSNIIISCSITNARTQS